MALERNCFLKFTRLFRFVLNFFTSQGLDLAHCELVVDWLAKLHGFSHVIMSRGGSDDDDREEDQDIHSRNLARKTRWVEDKNPWCRSAYGFPTDEHRAAEEDPEYQAQLRERFLYCMDVGICVARTRYLTGKSEGFEFSFFWGGRLDALRFFNAWRHLRRNFCLEFCFFKEKRQDSYLGARGF